MQTLQSVVSELQMLQIDEGGHYEIDDESCLPFRHIKNLGSGGSGIVEKILHTKTNSVYARKTFEVPPGGWDRVKEIFRREIEITRRLARHRHIVRLVASYSTPLAPTVILEPAADGGTLKDFLARFVSIDDETVKAPMRDTLYRAYGCLANGLAFIHRHEVRHRDIKPENVLLHGGAVLFTDFGISRDYSDRTRATTEGKPDSYTPRYCAPEVRFWERRTWKSDVFSLGCVFLVIYTAVWPNRDVEVIATTSWFHEHVDELQDIMESFSQDAEVVACMKGMLREEEGQRPSAVEVAHILEERKDRYFCEKCAEESSLYEEDILSSISNSSSIMTYDDEMSQYSGSTKHGGDISEGTDLGRSRANTLVHASDTFDIRTEYFKLLAKATARYSRGHFLFNATRVHYERPNPHQHTSTSYITSPHTAVTNGHSVKANFTLPYKESLIPTSSSLNRYGVQSHKVVRTIQTPAQPDTDNSQEEIIIHEDHVYEWTARYLGLGFRLRRRMPYGAILPSLSTYPVISEFDDFTWDLIHTGSIPEIQSSFAARKLHPFVQNESGEDLYHIALLARRVDICHLLQSHGARPSLSNNTSHLEQLIHASEYLPTSDVTSLLDFVLSSLDPYSNDDTVWPKMQHLITWPRETLLWLWHHAATYGLDVPTLNEFCLRMTLRHLAQCAPHERPAVQKLLLKFLTPALVHRIRNNELVFLDDLFAPFGADPFHLDILEENACEIGTIWLAVLTHRDIDILDYLAHEMDARPDCVLIDYAPEWYLTSEEDDSTKRRIVCTFSEEQGYGVSFREAETSPGQLVVDEFDPLVCRSEIGEWPFARAQRTREMKKVPGSWVE